MSDILYRNSRKFIIFLSIIFIISNFAIFKKVTVDAISNSSSQIVLEVDSKRILHAENAYEKKYMASTTKILTALVIIENCDLDEIITINKNTIGVEGSSIYLEEGEKLSVKDLLYGLMLRSGNDCALTLAVHCSKSVEKFAELMNETALRCGAKNSNFTNPHGLHDDNHYTTAYDLALISACAIKNATFKEIVSTKSIRIPHTNRDYDRVLINKNKMLKEFEGSTGIKTGFTKKAGRCLVTSCYRNGMELICVVLNCPPMFEQSKALLTKCFNDYSVEKLIDSNNIIDFITDSNGKSYAIHVKNDVILPLTKQELNDINVEYAYPKNVSFPLSSNEEIGKIKIYSKNNLLFEQKIYTI